MHLHRSTQRLRILAALAVAALAIFTLVVVGVAAATPGYRHATQFISELGASGAPHEWLVRLAGFLPIGALLLLFCVLAHVSLPRSKALSSGLAGLALYAVGYVVTAAFPCDPGCRPADPSLSQIIHNAGALISYVLAPLFLLALARAVRHWPHARPVAAAGYVAAALALAGIVTLSPSSALVGLSQRVIEFAVLGWVAVLGIYLAKSGPR